MSTAASGPSPHPRPPASRRRWALALLTLTVLLLHALLIAGWPVGRGEAWRRGGVLPLQTRQVVVPAAVAPEALLDPEPATSSTSAKPAAKASATSADASTAMPSASTAPPADFAAADAQAAAAPPLDAGGTDPPRYATSVPPAATLSYRFQRGSIVGEGTLTWRLEGERYELQLSGLARGAEALGWSSRGRVGELGLEPERFVARRRGRDWMAVNFERDAPTQGRITFSGPSVVLPLLPGVQDRVSWMLQLAAIVRADPSLGLEGREVSLWVVGPRADAEVWTFSVQPRRDLELPGGRLEGAVHLVREPRRPYDLRAEVWLDPARQHLPVRARLRVQPTGETTEFQLRTSRDR